MSNPESHYPASDTDDNFKNYTVEYDDNLRVLWGRFDAKNSLSFTIPLLSEMRRYDCQLSADESGGIRTKGGLPVDFYIWGSRMPGFFSLGGDLAYFVDCISTRNRSALLDYATLCIDVIALRVCNYHSPSLITLSLAQGDAFGGGFEAAMASDIIIAEEQARFGLPEIAFNLFPGMGAYSILSRRAGPQFAKAFILSGEIYSAQACLEMGVIDAVVPEGQGVKAVNEYINKIQSSRNGVAAIYNARRTISPVTHQELMAVTTQWVDAALRLEEKDLRLMMKLVKRQKLKLNSP